MPDWVESLHNAKKTCLVQDGKRKVHYKFDDGNEMVEEYALNTHDLIVRKHKRKTMTGKECDWEFEVGQDFQPRHLDTSGFAESIENPIFTRKDTKDSFQWRIRNLPYPRNTYNISIENNFIVVKTTNKKYYKKFTIPDMVRLNLNIDQANLSYDHFNNTLIITYKKPSKVLEHERNIINEIKKANKSGEGDVELCSIC